MTNNQKPIKNTIYTRNFDNLNEGYRFSNIVLFDKEEEELDLHSIKNIRVCITIPTFNNSFFTNEVSKLDTILKDYDNISCFLISNEPVFTQSRLSRTCTFEKFKILSDFKKREFARASGTYVYELQSLVKSIFIVDAFDRILYVRYYDDLYSNFDANEIVEILNEA